MNREHVLPVFLILFLTIYTLATTPSARSVPNSSSESPAVEWNKTYGGGSATSIQQASDGEYILAGSTSPSTDYDSADFLLVRTDDLGNTLWNETYGGSLRDEAYDVQVTKDGGYIVAGRTESFGVQNAWIIKLAPDVVPEFSSFLVLPLFMIATLLAILTCRKKRFYPI